MKKQLSSNQLKLDLKVKLDHNRKRDYGIYLKDSTLFGSDDAAHVNFELLKSYSYNRKDCKEYIDESKAFMILCAPKGTGKTTLIRLWQNELANKEGYISIIKFDSQISPSNDNASYSKWIRLWKRNITLAVFHNIINDRNFKISSSKFKFIEKIGNRADNDKGFIDLIVESSHDIDESTKSHLLQKRKNKIWVFIDEIDQYFTRTNQDILKMASLLTACRELTSYIPNLYIRTTIKPNVWAILRTEQASMSNISELVVKYRWNASNIKTIIAKRIKSYIIRKHFNNDEITAKNLKYLQNEDWLINQIFDPESDFDLSNKNKKKRTTQKIQPHKTIAQLGSLRPRWALSLCKMAANNLSSNDKYIKIENIINVMPKYGQDRIVDIAAEFKTQCQQINQIINSFYKETSNYSNYNYLLDKINEIVINKMNVNITGVNEKCSAEEVVRFLFQIGFIEPKNIISSKRYEFIHFENFPTFIDTNDTDSISKKGITWEIHPSFRNALSLDRPHFSIDYKNKKVHRNA